MFPKMDITTSGSGLVASKAGTVTKVSENEVVAGGKTYQIAQEDKNAVHNKYFPSKKSWQEVVVEQNQQVQKKDLLAEGITQIHFEANMWVYLVLVILIGAAWGIGAAAVYKHIPDYFPNEVGVIGGMVGLLGGLGGFFGPIIFGYLLSFTGFWTSSWMFILAISLICLIWMHRIVVNLMKEKSPEYAKDMDRKN
jgi:NNP family nitrate/nitrite transporter-like MFS transporter